MTTRSEVLHHGVHFVRNPANLITVARIAASPILFAAILANDDRNGTSWVAFALGWVFQLPITQRISITYEVGVQNISLASLVMLTVLQNQNYFIVAVVYAAIMKLTAMGFMYFARQWLAREERTAAERASAATA